jgi:hypothetical protein
MALIKCPECGKEISDKAPNCPNCGFPVSDMGKESSSQDKIPEAEHETSRSDSRSDNTVSNIQIKKYLPIAIIAVIALIVIIIVPKALKKEPVIHNVTWGMSHEQVEEAEWDFNGKSGDYDESYSKYSADNVDFYGKSAHISYRFDEKDKLNEIYVYTTAMGYGTAYDMALEICKEEGCPVEFIDETDTSEPTATLIWHKKGTTIELKTDFTSKYGPLYSFTLTPYKGNDFGKAYREDICQYGSKSFFPCRNEKSPWAESEFSCKDHGCKVIGCPDSQRNVHDGDEQYCSRHYHLIE